MNRAIASGFDRYCWVRVLLMWIQAMGLQVKVNSRNHTSKIGYDSRGSGAPNPIPGRWLWVPSDEELDGVQKRCRWHE
jgi:hypothetical protein